MPVMKRFGNRLYPSIRMKALDIPVAGARWPSEYPDSLPPKFNELIVELSLRPEIAYNTLTNIPIWGLCGED